MSGPHLVHGLGTGLEAPAWPPITQAEAAAALAHFPATGALIALDWHSPRPFSAAAMARTTTGDWLIKRHAPALRTPTSLAQEHAFIAHLAGRGVPVAKVASTATGASALALSGWTYEVHARAPGADLYRERQSWTPFLAKPHAHAAGVALARLHRAATGFAAPARASQPLVSSLSILMHADPLAAVQSYAAERPALAGYLATRAWQAPLARLFAALSANSLAVPLGQQQALWTHNDWHASNLLWATDDTVASVLDFGLADKTCALNDLATALERNAFAWLTLGQGADAALADHTTIREMLAGYASIIPLARDDLALLARLLPVVHVEFALSEADYFAGILGRPQDANLAFDGYLIGHGEWFLSAAGRDCLALIERF